MDDNEYEYEYEDEDEDEIPCTSCPNKGWCDRWEARYCSELRNYLSGRRP